MMPSSDQRIRCFVFGIVGGISRTFSDGSPIKGTENSDIMISCFESILASDLEQNIVFISSGMIKEDDFWRMTSMEESEAPNPIK